VVGIGQDFGGQRLLHVDGFGEREDFDPSFIQQLDVVLVVCKFFMSLL